MREYINSIISTVIVCQIAVMFSPSADGARRYVRLICTLVVLLTLISPVRALVGDSESLVSSLRDFFKGQESDAAEDVETGGELKQFAYAVMRAVADNFGINSDNIRLTLVTNDDSEVEEVQLYLAATAYSDRERIRETLEAELGIPVYVFPER